MASRIDFVEFVCSQLQALGSIYPRKMFGDYMVYVNGKAVILTCDNIAYVKMHPGIADLMAEAETGCPYEGAKPHYILDVEHKATLLKTVRTLETLLPYPKEKSKPERTAAKIPHPFKHLPNVGEQTEKDLLSMGYTSVEALRGKKAEALYEEECKMRGCIVDRCQLYLYRALEYYLNTDNPDKEKCKWWHWKDDFYQPSPCGARCVECAAFPSVCKGCRSIKGKVFCTIYGRGRVPDLGLLPRQAARELRRLRPAAMQPFPERPFAVRRSKQSESEENDRQPHQQARLKQTALIRLPQAESEACF